MPLEATAASKLPLGLLDLFGMRALGRYPNQLASFVQTNLELLELMCAIHGENLVFGPSNISAIGFTPSGAAGLVPQDQVWYLQHLSCSIVSGAGEAFTGNGGFLLNDGGTDYIPLTERLAVAANVTAVLAALVPGRWLPQNARLGVFTDAVTITPTFQFSARILRLRF